MQNIKKLLIILSIFMGIALLSICEHRHVHPRSLNTTYFAHCFGSKITLMHWWLLLILYIVVMLIVNENN